MSTLRCHTQRVVLDVVVVINDVLSLIKVMLIEYKLFNLCSTLPGTSTPRGPYDSETAHSQRELLVTSCVFFSIIGIDVYVFCYCVRVRYLLCVLCALCTAVECIPQSFVIYVKRAVIFPNPTNTHIKKHQNQQHPSNGFDAEKSITCRPCNSLTDRQFRRWVA